MSEEMEIVAREAFAAGFDLGSDWPLMSRRDFSERLARYVAEAMAARGGV